MTLALRLEIISYQKESAAQPSSMELQGNTLSIGRDKSNDWCLADPDRILSKSHCRIEAQPQGFLLFDMSTNGVYLNQAPQPIGKGNSVKLSHGDRFRISDYDIKVSSEDSPVTDRSDDYEQAMSPPPPLVQANDASTDWHNLLTPSQVKPVEHAQSEVEMPVMTQTHYDAPDIGVSIPEDWSSQSETAAPPQLPESSMPVEPKQPTAAQPTSSQADLLSVFLSGAGLPNEQRLAVAPEQLMHELGSLFRCMTEGMIGVLAARGDIKGEFRLAQTMIKPTDNNPLKFSLNVEEAMLSLLAKRGEGYMNAQRAFEEAFDDLKAHQVAMLAGMQHALQSLLNTFDPQRIEQANPASGGMSKLLGQRKSAYWDNYILLYKTLCRDGEQDAQNLFGRDFAKAYEQQIKNQKQRG
ncbi:type VI secretion system-associated FHA domain protein TagH [Bowmanella pacifica]|uniref:Phosphopeptide-binding protein n=1 Tax=Bowmanella pacifica TaxID=502051 RepID=A0A917YTZ2_9ALTE|nr:type VI secretion system-associated FHA domain protein TagH [Bowmanella pacifica]GGO66628.1 phosphopeptide-binding protein [Bowmanella pacifica]